MTAMEVTFIKRQDIPIVDRLDFKSMMARMIVDPNEAVQIECGTPDKARMVQIGANSSLRRHAPDGYRVRTRKDNSVVWAWIEKVGS